MKLNFLLDENIPYAFISFFENMGFKVEHIKKIGMTGSKNGEVYKYAEKEKCWILTRDADFQNYIKFTNYNIEGILLLKLKNTQVKVLVKIVSDILDKHIDMFDSKHLIIVEDTEISFLD